MKSTTSSSSRYLVGIAIFAMAVILSPMVAGLDPFGSLRVEYQERLEAGSNNSRVDLGLSLPKGSDVYDVAITIQPEDPILAVSDRAFIGKMGSGTMALATFYVAVNESGTPGIYEVPATISYKAEFGPTESVSRTVLLVISERIADPFGSMVAVTDPAVIVPGLGGLEVVLSLPYTGPDDPLYDVSLTLDLDHPFSSANATNHLGVVPSGTLGVATFYLDVAEGAVSGEYDVPVLVRYRLSPDGVFRSASKVAKLFVVSEEVDPFGSLGVVTDPGVLVPGLRGVEVRLSVPYLGGLVDRLYDVSVSLGLVSPFSSEYDTYHLGVMTPQSPVGPTPTSVFHVDIGEGDVCREYEIPVTIRYQLTADGEAREVQRSFKMAVVDPDPVWIVRRLSERLPSGSSSTVSILLENLGGHATDVTAQFVPASPALVKPDEGTVFAGDFGINQSKKLSFPVIVDDDVDGSQQITIRVEYNSGGSRILESHSITLMIGGTEGASLVLKEVAFSPEPMIGSEFEAQLTIHNVGPENAKEALMDLQLPEQITVVGSGSTFNIGEIEAGKSVSISFRLVSDSSATEGTGEVQYLLSWRNPEGEESGRGGSFGLTLTGSPTVVIQRIDIDPPKLEGGTKGTLQVTVRNPGSQLVTDIAIVLKGTPEFFTETLLPIGSLFPKQTDAVVFGLYIDQDTESGTYPVNVSVTYRDASGQEHEEFSDLQLRIHEKKPLLNWVTILIVAAVIAAIVIIYIVFGGSGSRDRPSVDEEES